MKRKVDYCIHFLDTNKLIKNGELYRELIHEPVTRTIQGKKFPDCN